jgi:hypothetical protein
MSSQELPAARHEHRDLDERFVWYAVAAMAALLIVCALATLWLYPKSRLDRTLPWPLAKYPAPELQPNPQGDMSAFYASEMRKLQSRGWDHAHRVAHIPIEEAVRKVAEEGIAGWPDPDAAPPKSGLEAGPPLPKIPP